MSGTSMSTPLVVGVAALLKLYRPDLRGLDLKSILLATVDILPGLAGKIETGGRINAHSAILKTQNYAAPDPLPHNWTASTTLSFTDSDNELGVLNGTVEVQFADEIGNARYLVFYFAREDTLLHEIMRVNIGTVIPARRLRSLHNVVGNGFATQAHHMRRLLASFQYALASLVVSGATHLALKIGNDLGLAEDALRIPLVDNGVLTTPPLFAVTFIDTDVRPGMIAGSLSFTGAHSERAVSSYIVHAGAPLAEIAARGMDSPSCDAASTSCELIHTYWRDDATFVFNRTAYGNLEFASYTFHGPGAFVFEYLHVEAQYDYVKIGDRTYTGSTVSDSAYTVPAGPITVIWYSDYSTVYGGFTLLFTPHNFYAVDIGPTPVGSLKIYATHMGTMAPNGQEVPVTDLATQLRIAFEDRNYAQGRVQGPLHIDVLYRAQAEGIKVYFGATGGPDVLHSTHGIPTSRDAYALDVPVPASVVRAYVVLTDASGAELPTSARMELGDKFANPPSGIHFGADRDMRRHHIHGQHTIKILRGACVLRARS